MNSFTMSTGDLDILYGLDATPKHEPAMQPRLQYNRKQAAAMLNYSVTVFDLLVRRGLIHANRATARPQFSVEELERFCREGSKRIGV